MSSRAEVEARWVRRSDSRDDDGSGVVVEGVSVVVVDVGEGILDWFLFLWE